MQGRSTLILGCGTLGVAVGLRLAAAGVPVVGVRRSAEAGDPGFTLVVGDAADPALHDHLAREHGAFASVLFAANPGVRRGRDNRLLDAARLIAERHAAARVVYTGSTALYADAAGGGVAEDGALDAAPAAQALRAIEVALAGHRDALVLRATALVGPTRTFARERLRAANGGSLVLKGDPERPFSWIHEDDLVELCLRALGSLSGGPGGALGRGVLNAAAPGRTTVRGYYAGLAASEGLTVDLRGDGTAQPSRWIDGARLHALVPDLAWRGFT